MRIVSALLLLAMAGTASAQYGYPQGSNSYRYGNSYYGNAYRGYQDYRQTDYFRYEGPSSRIEFYSDSQRPSRRWWWNW